MFAAAMADQALAACPDFAPAMKFPSGGLGAGAVVAADFNDDHKVDLAVLNTTSSSVVLLLGNGDGTFALQPAPYPVGANASTISEGDFNGDGRTDLAIPSFTANGIAILLSRGDGTMSASTVSHAIAGRVATGDFNGDGKTDLVVTRLNGEIWFQAGAGNGTFGTAVQSPPPARGGLMTEAELNGDGKRDLVSLGDGVQALLGTGNGTFTAAPQSFNTGGSGSRQLALGDFDRDGKVDVAVANTSSNNLSILLGLGNGQFGAPMTYPSGNGPWFAAVYDFTRDGRLDVAVANEFSNDVAVFAGNGNGTFAPAVKFGVGELPVGIAAADFNGDGKADIAAVDFSSNDVSILLSRDTCSPPRRRPVKH